MAWAISAGPAMVEGAPQGLQAPHNPLAPRRSAQQQPPRETAGGAAICLRCCLQRFSLQVGRLIHVTEVQVEKVQMKWGAGSHTGATTQRPRCWARR